MKGFERSSRKKQALSESVHKCQHLIKLILPPPQCWCSPDIHVFKKIKSVGSLSSISESHKCYIWYPELGSKKFIVFTVSPFLQLAFLKIARHLVNRTHGLSQINSESHFDIFFILTIIPILLKLISLGFFDFLNSDNFSDFIPF